MNQRRPKQPGPLPRGKKSAPEVYEVCYPPSVDGHLTEEQKKWPRVTEEWTREEFEALQQQRQAEQQQQQQPPTN
jgi:hypothetical protein